MSDRDIGVSLEVISRSEEKVIKRSELETRLYTILANYEHGSDEYEGIADALALLLQIKRIAGKKGRSTKKGSEVLKLLDLSAAKISLREQRDQMVCVLIANDSLHSGRDLNVIKDQLTHLTETDISEVNRTWQKGRDLALSGANNELSVTQIDDIKTAINAITATIRKSTGK